jgi:hypothetical protein
MNQKNMADRQQRIGQRIQNLRPVQKFNEFKQGIAGRQPTEKEMQTGERLRSRIEANPRFQQLQERANGIGQKQMSAPPMPQQDNQSQQMQQAAQAQKALQQAQQQQGKMGSTLMQQAMQNPNNIGSPSQGGIQASQTPIGMPQQVGGNAASAMGLGAPTQGLAGLMGKPMGGPPMGAGAGFGGGAPTSMGGAPAPMGMKKGGRVKAYAKGGAVSSKPKASSASSRGDGIAQRGKTKGRFV